MAIAHLITFGLGFSPAAYLITEGLGAYNVIGTERCFGYIYG